MEDIKNNKKLVRLRRKLKGHLKRSTKVKLQATYRRTCNALHIANQTKKGLELIDKKDLPPHC